MSVEHVFIDTNILVYAHDRDAGEKHEYASKKIKSLWLASYPPAISTQVLHELYVTLIRKEVSDSICREIVSTYFAWEVIGSDSQLIISAMTIRERFRLSYWDALIVAAAQKAKAEVLWSEDLKAKQKFDGLTVINPLVA